MLRSFRTLTHPFFIPMCLTLACGGGQVGSVPEEESPIGGAAGEDTGEGGRAEATSKGGGAGRGGSGSSTGDSEADAGSGAGGVSAGGAAGEAGSNAGDEPPPCVSTGSDTPDSDFADTNCDGIDGDLSRAVFVSPEGVDGAAGTFDAPLGSIEEAIEVAATSERDVYVCNGTFTEPVTITKPVAIYGGYDCENVGRRTKDRAVFAPERGIALSVQNVVGAVHIERLAFRSADAVSPGESSQAGSVVASSSVHLSRVEFSAGKGAAGKPGAPGADASQVPPFTGARGGNAPTTACNADAMTSACEVTATNGFDQRLTQTCEHDGITKTQLGGPGGTGANVWIALGRPRFFDAKSVTATGALGSVGSYFDGTRFLSFHHLLASQHGAAGQPGADATRGFGSISAGVYAADNWGSNAKDGAPGYPGKGGQGGSSWTIGGDLAGGTTFYVGAGGAQGGVGGCGGQGALGGGAGGASIALVVDNSPVSIELSQIITTAGGAGQNGHPGGQGQRGGAPGNLGTAVTGAKATAGGVGGDGGRGGDSGAGAGGPSIGLVHVGVAPAVTDTTYVIGTGGRGGVSVRTPNVVNGISADLYDATPAL